LIISTLKFPIYNFLGLIIILLSLTLVFQNLTLAQNINTKIKFDDLTDFISLFKYESKNIKGGFITIASSGEIIYEDVFGYKNDDSLADEKTNFPIASLSKPLTASIIAALAQNQRINFQTKINGIFRKEDNITLNHILSHTSGYLFNGNKEIDLGQTHKQLIQSIKKDKQKFKPGEKYYYSNAIFSLTEDILQFETNQTFEQIINEFWLKLGNRYTGFCISQDTTNLAHPFKKINGVYKAIPHPLNYQNAACTAGGMYLNLLGAKDFLLLQLGHRDDILSQNSLNILYQTYVKENDFLKKPVNWPFKKEKITSYYGLGWRIFKLQKYDLSLVFHSGSLNGVSSFVGLIPELDVGIFIVLNQNSSLALQAGMNFLKLAATKAL
jgi:CubicO group peptidase (beta-lactamase class C family)